MSNFRHRYKCEALFHHEGDTFWWKTRREWDGMKMIFWTCLRRWYLDWRDFLLDLSIFCLIECKQYQNTEFEMDNNESATSSINRDRHQRRLREIKTKGMDWNQFHFRWLNIKGFDQILTPHSLSITLCFNHLKWNSP